MLGRDRSAVRTTCHRLPYQENVSSCPAYFRAHVAWIMAAFNILAKWGLELDDNDMVHLSIAEFSL